MYRITSLFFLFFILLTEARSQVIPKEGSKLNYRIVGFSFPSAKQQSNYEIEIATGNFNSVNSFKEHVIKKISSTTNKIITEVPNWGSEYTWRSMNTPAEQQNLHHFSTGIAHNADSNQVRLRILKKAEKYGDAYVFLDGNMALYDMSGHAMWYLPNVDSLVNEHAEIRDIKLTSKGTITFINDDQAYEINFNGKVLWKAPNSGKISHDKEEYYHHEFTRLSNGHYMILGNEFVPVKIQVKDDFDEPQPGASAQKMIQFGTIIEYDEHGNVAWSWKASKYFKDMKLYYPIKPNGKQENTMHENAFYFDEKNKMVYASFKNAGIIVKIKYPEGSIVNTYGKLYHPGDGPNNLFCEQHSCKVSQQGYLMLYNNNTCNWERTPSLQMYKEPVSKNDSLQKVWEYVTTAEVASTRSNDKPYSTSGGNIIELPDQSLFASMGSPFANIFIVSQDKEIQWNAIPEKWVDKDKKWKMAEQYRASIITDRKQLEQLIWNAEQ